MASDGDAAPLLTSSGDDKPRRRRNMYAFGCATLASMTTILMGYNLALMSGAQLFVREDMGLSDAEIEVLTGSMNVFMLVSILAAGWAADVLGRRGTIVLANAFLMAGALAMSLGATYAALMAARFVTSIGVGFARVVAPVYNAEISPASTRGVLTSLLDMFINVGILLSYVSNYALAGLPVHIGWRVMFGIGAVPPVFLAAAVLAMPESPRWLAMRGRHADARVVLARTSDSVEEADLRLEEIKHAVAAPHEAGGGVCRELLFRPSAMVRRVLACVIGLQFFQQASGIDAIVLYSPLVFKKAGMASNTSVLGATVAVGVVKTCFILVATLFSDRLGRRPLLLASTGGMTITLTSLALTLCVASPSTASAAACVASVMAFVAAFSVGLGPTTATYTAEVMPLRLRAQGTGLGVAVNRLACGAVTMTFISLADGITMAGCFFLYAGVAATACVFVYVWLPETRGRSLENMDMQIKKNPAMVIMAHDGGGGDAAAAGAPLLPSSGDKPCRRCNMYAFGCATLASMTTILMGYNLALMSGAQLFVREDMGLSDAEIEVLTGSMNVFMLVSILAAGWAADVLGRRGTLVLANAFLMAGALAMSLGATYAALMAARFVTSIGVGFALVVAPVYNAEISPASARGVLSTLFEMFVNVGILLSYVSNYALSGLPVHLGWRVMFGVGVLPPVFLAAGVLAMPESPRWLAMRGRDADARAVLARTSDSVEEAELRLEKIKHAFASLQENGGGVWRELLLRPTAKVRRILTCVIGLQFFQQASGVNVIVLYSPVEFKKAGMESNTAVLGATVAVGVAKTCSILVATLFSDRLGRRPLLLASTGGVAVTLASLALTLSIASPSAATAAACVASVMAFVAAFSAGLGPMTAAYTAEVMPLRLRAQGASLGIAVNRLTCGVMSMTFISLAGGITMPGCFFLYAGVAAAACVFVYVRLPETRGRSLEDMDALFHKVIVSNESL
uniref:Major facilitator superfamily (MFS) profile domain-containing protein n=1 Tax=Oryza punctata TaxID=4537 RepID=A0A0E0MHH3_ORYPU